MSHASISKRDEVKLAVFQQKASSYDFHWVLENLWENRCVGLDLIDTVIFEEGEPLAWYFTGKNGQIMKKASKNVAIDRIKSQFITTALKYDGNMEQNVCAVSRDGGLEVMNIKDFSRMMMGRCVSNSVESMQQYVVPKGSTNNNSMFPSYTNQYILQHDGAIKCNTYKLSVPTTLKKRESIRCKSNTITNLLNSYTSTIVKAIEANFHCIVLKLEAEYVIDTDDCGWLVRTNETTVVMKEKNTASVSTSKPSYFSHNDDDTLKLSPINVSSLRNTNKTPTNSGVLKASPLSATSNKLPKVSSPLYSNSKEHSLTCLSSQSYSNECAGDFCDTKLSLLIGEHKKNKLEVNDDNEVFSGSSHKLVTYRSVVQARNEAKLVELLLYRIKHNEENDYLSSATDSPDKVLLAQSYPTHYYRQVKVCKACYKIYCKIEEERKKSLEKLHRVHHLSTDSDTPTAAAAAAETIELPAERKEGEDELIQQAMRRANQAIEQLTKNDVAEFRSFAHPPEQIVKVSEALMLLLLGRRLKWGESRKVLSNGDKFLTMLVQFDPSQVTHQRMKLLTKYVSDPDFRPKFILPVNRSAAALCSWILGMLQIAHLRYQHWNGSFHPRIDPLKDSLLMQNDGVTLLSELDVELPHSAPTNTPSFIQQQLDKFHQQQAQQASNANTISSLRQQRHLDRQRPNTTESLSEVAAEPAKRAASHMGLEEFDSDVKLVLSPKRSLYKTTYNSNNLKSKQVNFSKREKSSRHKAQQRQMARLHNPEADNNEESDGTSTKVFTCADGFTTIPYEVIGRTSVNQESRIVNLVIIQDLFDTLESMQIFLESTIKRRLGCQALVLNYSGQAHTRYIGDPSTINNTDTVVLNNEYIASTLHELLQFTQKSGEFATSYLPFYILGFGNGANIGAYFALKYGTTDDYRKGLKGLISVNGYANIDKDLAAILHSSVNVFNCFPNNRPDLPISYFTRFLFSDDYLKRVDPNLVLNIYTAVNNPISLTGRIKICTGALKHKDIRPDLKKLKVPLIVVQSTENVLVNPTNVDAFIEGRMVSHLWSHQVSKSNPLNAKSMATLRATLKNPNGAFVIWLKSGHEVRQECKNQLLEIIDRLISPESASELEEQPTVKPSVKQPSRTATVASTGDAAAETATAAATATASPTAWGEERNGADVSSAPSTFAVVETAEDRERKRKLQQAEHELQQMMAKHQSSASRAAQQEELISQSRQLREERAKNLSFAASNSGVVKKRHNKPDADTMIRQSLQGSGLDYDHVVRASKQESVSDAINRRLAEAETTRAKQQEEQLQRKIAALKQEQDERRRQWEQEDAGRIEQLEQELEQRRTVREQQNARRWEQIDNATLSFDTAAETVDEAKGGEESKTEADDAVVAETEDVDAAEDESTHTKAAAEAEAEAAAETEEPQMEQLVKQKQDLVTQRLTMLTKVPKRATLHTMFEEMEAEEVKMKEVGTLETDDYEKVKQQLMRAEAERRAMEIALANSEQDGINTEMAVRIQRVGRGYLGRRRFEAERQAQILLSRKVVAATYMQAVRRGFVGRRKVQLIRELKQREQLVGQSVRLIQKVWRGYQGRMLAMHCRQDRDARLIQRVYRGHLGRTKAYYARKKRDRLLLEFNCATKIQATWRMRVGREEYMFKRITELAATQIQRIYRGMKGRRRAERKREWESAKPGPERLQLGLSLIEESKQAFSSQQEEIDALHRAQERAETRVSVIHAGLKESEKELAVLEQELKDIDQLDSTLSEMKHDKDAFDNQPSAEETAKQQGITLSAQESREAARKRAAESYALEMAIHLKRAERERKKKELESEFAGVFQEVEYKKTELAQLEVNIQDMEATRKRKEREFERLQRNLMELLEEQKSELDNLRERGIELETATAVSAAAAAATAQAAKENEERSKAMFNNTEELMKFQFMSMSLSYFSSLNMLKSLRDINSDTTQAAVTSSASTAASAAAATAAANIPSMTHMKLGTRELIEAAEKKKRQVELDKRKEIERAKQHLEKPFPEEMKAWTIEDVGRWLDTLSLGQYKQAFAEATVDGDFLIELRPQDMRDVLGMEHVLHVQKLVLARDKLRPLNPMEMAKKNAVEWEQRGDHARESIEKKEEAKRIPDVATVFSLIRNGRYKKVEQALNDGFIVDAVDSNGNTGLLVSAQNINKKLMELFLQRGANINHQNKQGNTTMHYAMAYDPEGTLGEFLIEMGADDTIENKVHLSPYDGIE